MPPVKRTGSTSSATQQKANTAKANAGFTITQTADDEDDEDEWVSSSGAQTPNQDDSNSDTASEGDSIPHELAVQLQRAQIEQQQQQAAPTQASLPRVDTARQSDFNAVIAPKNGVPKQPPPTETPFPTTNSDPNPHSDRISQYVEHDRPWAQPQQSSDLVGMSTRETNHTRTESRQIHPSKRQSVTRPPSTHSIPSRSDNMRPHPLIRGHSQGLLNLVPKPSPLTPLAVITDQPSSTSDNTLSGSPESIKTSVTSPGGYTAEFPQGRRTSISSTRSVSTLPAQSAGLPQDRTRALSTISMTASTTALNSLAHLPSVTRPPSPQQISFFPPVNPHVNIEAIHPLLPGPYLNNHLTVLARRTPLRESYDRVIQAKSASGR